MWSTWQEFKWKKYKSFFKESQTTMKRKYQRHTRYIYGKKKNMENIKKVMAGTIFDTSLLVQGWPVERQQQMLWAVLFKNIGHKQKYNSRIITVHDIL